MLKPEQAKTRLAEWQLPAEENRIEKEIDRLPAKLRDLAKRVYLSWTDEEQALAAEEGHDKVQKRKRQAAVEIDRLPVKERAKIFGVVSPQLAPVMEQTWQLLKTTPYEGGHQRRAFRAPHHPEVLAETLRSWMSEMAEVGKSFPAELLTPAWLAAWAPHLSEGWRDHAEEIGALLAATLNRGGAEADDVFEILSKSLHGQHEVGAPGRHIYTSFLLSDQPEAWQAIEKTLLAAQRQEGLRQAILEQIDFAHPEAFRRMVRLILEHDLYRFSSVVRAVDVWFGEMWAAASGGVIKKMLGQLVEFLDKLAARDKALRGKDAEAAFLALWCAATEDAVASIPLAEKLLTAKTPELRYVAARHLVNLQLNLASKALIPALDDDDLRVAWLGIPEGYYEVEEEDQALGRNDRFERLERLVDQVPAKPQKLKPIVWPWNVVAVNQASVASYLLVTLGDRPAMRLIPHLRKMDSHGRARATQQIVDAKPWDKATRQAVLDLAGDASTSVREVALEALKDQKLSADEVTQLESYLTRKTGDLRSAILSVLLKQTDKVVLASSSRLLAAKDANQRLAGLELLRLMTDAKRAVAECREQASAYQAARKKVNKEERAQLDEIATEKTAVATLDDALGLMNPADRSPVVAPRNLKVPFVTRAAIECLKSLDELVHKHRDQSIALPGESESEDRLLGNVQWGFPSPDFDKPREAQEKRLPLADVWKKWFAERGEDLRDSDGMELVRARTWANLCGGWNADQWKAWAKSSAQRKAVAKLMSGGHESFELRYQSVVNDVVDWLVCLYPCDARNYLLDVIETAFSQVPADDIAQHKDPHSRKKTKRNIWESEEEEDWRDETAYQTWPEALSYMLNSTREELSPEQSARLWQLMHWRDQPVAGGPRRRPESALLRDAYSAGAANLADVADQLLGPRETGRYQSSSFDLLTELTARRPEKMMATWLAKHADVRELVNRAVARVVDLELSRGDAPTAATEPAKSLGALAGIEMLRRILHALGKNEFKVSPMWRYAGSDDRRQSLTNLAKITFPAEGETPDTFAEVMKAAASEEQFPEERLLQLVFLAPQWIKFVEAYFGWERMSEGVYWLLAHMRYVGGLGEVAAEAAGQDAEQEEAAEESASGDGEESESAPKRERLSAWERLILERTPLTNSERDEGAIDVPWFRKTYAELGDKRWQLLATAARFAANASQAKRATFVADVLLNKVSRKELVEGIKKRQLKDHVRLLGLLPLAKGKKSEADLLERCKVLREYRRYANQLSGLTKPAALRSWEIGMRNMAQTAGYADPLRLEWAIGAEAVKDLTKGPVAVKKGDVTVSLSLDELSKPVVTVRKGDKELKSIPPAIKKDKKIAELTGRVSDLKKQATGIRQSLETAMCRGDGFSGTELRDWCAHALVAPMLSRLVVIGEGIMGYPDKQGKALRDHQGKLEPVKANEKLRLAHPDDLLEAGDWQDWQHECFRSERVQPFKQVFRELYVVTNQEIKDVAVSHRYDGQQVQPTQALALFGQRGWNTQDGIFKVFHDVALSASVDFESGVTTPLEVEGATLAGVSFTKRDQWKPIPLKEVPPRLFSEVMRDLDLVVSVAHAGGVDPEASASTVEMRENLLRETCELLNLKNIQFKPSHALIEGHLAEYSVHLGSGNVHVMPGGALCIVPVHSQHRGRLFLPFADDDPRTAEIISKVLLLSRDQEIQDPTILEQIRR